MWPTISYSYVFSSLTAALNPRHFCDGYHEDQQSDYSLLGAWLDFQGPR
jgi:hypothetical protein